MSDQERRSSANSYTPATTGTSPAAWASSLGVAPGLRGGYFPWGFNANPVWSVWPLLEH
ncbi:MAG: hypothetical protein Q7K57_54745 [Burkholderiaceae bacterium]|nr:hypothetical protein [Burkholderiaceae bacterium]